MWAEKRAASPPECGSHSQMTAGMPIQNGCSDSWRAWRSTHGTLARQLSCAQLFTLGVTRLLAMAPPPPVTSCINSNFWLFHIGLDL